MIAALAALAASLSGPLFARPALPERADRSEGTGHETAGDTTGLLVLMMDRTAAELLVQLQLLLLIERNC
uniref:Putative secreted protein n=1 Tax=Anopheles triannulatus TaxID=58253 RepID=A0A2M4B5L0_9DIPT